VPTKHALKSWKSVNYYTPMILNVLCCLSRPLFLLFEIRTLWLIMLRKMHALLHEFNELLPLVSTSVQELEQQSKFFMVLTLHGLVDKFWNVYDQILGSPVIFYFTSTPPFCIFHVNLSMIHMLLPMTHLHWHLNMGITIAARASQVWPLW